jgi:hypothetical protein
LPSTGHFLASVRRIVLYFALAFRSEQMILIDNTRNMLILHSSC